MRVEYGYDLLSWSRKRCADWVKSKRCVECGQRRLYPGPDYDRFRVTCLNCGARFAIKPPEDALK